MIEICISLTVLGGVAGNNYLVPQIIGLNSPARTLRLHYREPVHPTPGSPGSHAPESQRPGPVSETPAVGVTALLEIRLSSAQNLQFHSAETSVLS